MKKRIVSLLLSAVVVLGTLSDSVTLSVNATELASEEIVEEISEEDVATSEELSEEIPEDNSEEKTEENTFETPDNLEEFKPVEVESRDLMGAVFGRGEVMTFALDEEEEGAATTIDQMEKYDPRVDAQELVTPTKNQNPYGTCWAFGAIAAMESGLIKKGLADNSIDLSEMHLAYFAFNEACDPLGISSDDIPYDNPNYLDNGSNVGNSITTFANWHGAASEENYPYSKETAQNMTEEDAVNNDYILKNAYLVPTLDEPLENRKAIMKKLVADYGAVTIAYYSDDSSYNYAEDYVSFNYVGETTCNHEVVLVGWDDNFPVENFVNQPAEPGAWLLKNSWDDNWGNDGGYFYVSYEDTSIGIEAAVFDAVDAGTYENNYHHCNVADYIYHENYSQVAEVFEIQKGKEEIKAVSFGLNVDSVPYELSIYKLSGNKVSNPTDGELLLTQYGMTGLAGYYTVDLEEQIVANAGDKIAIVLSFDEKIPVWLAMPSDENIVFPGESFYFENNKWGDFSNRDTNARINLLTNTLAEENEEQYFTVTYINNNGRVLAEKQVKAGRQIPELMCSKRGYRYVPQYDTDMTVTKDMTVLVKQEIIEYSITYELNGGEVEGELPSTYTVETETFYLPAPVKENTFYSYWECSNTTVYEGVVSKGTIGDLVFTACYEEATQDYYDGEIEFESNDITLEVGDTYQLEFAAGPDYMPVYYYESEATDIADVWGEGFITAYAPGETVITYGILGSDGEFRTFPIHVTVIPTERLKVSPFEADENGVLKYYEGTPVEMYAPEGASIYYTLNGKEPTKWSKKYTKPFTLSKDTELKVCYMLGKEKSEVQTYDYKFARTKAVLKKSNFVVNLGDSFEIEVLKTPELMAGETEPEYVSYTEYGVVEAIDGCTGYLATKPGKTTVSIWYNISNGQSVETEFEVTVRDTNKFFIRPEAEAGAETVNFETEVDGVRIFAPAGAEVYYTTDGSVPSVDNGICYEYPLYFYNETVLKAIYVKRNDAGEIVKTSKVIEQVFEHGTEAPVMEANELTVKVGETVKLNVAQYPSITSDFEQIYMSYSYNRNYVSVDIDGNVTGLKPGQCEVECCVELGFGELSAAASVMITVVEADELKLFPSVDNDGEVCVYDQGTSLYLVGPSDCDIFYTTDGSEPTSSSTFYKKSFILNGDAVVKAIAMRDGEIVDRVERSYKYYRVKPIVTNKRLVLTEGDIVDIEGIVPPDDCGEDVDYYLGTDNYKVAEVLPGNKIRANNEGKASIGVGVYDHNGNYQCAYFAVTVEKNPEFEISLPADYLVESDVAYIYAPEGAHIFYSTSDYEPFTEYDKKMGVYLYDNATIRAYYVLDDYESDIIEKEVLIHNNPVLIPNNQKVNLGEAVEFTLEDEGETVAITEAMKPMSYNKDVKFAVSDDGTVLATKDTRGSYEAVLTYTNATGRVFTVYSGPVTAVNGVFDVTGVKDMPYTGSPVTFADLVAHNAGDESSGLLAKDVDYSVSYANNTNVGTAQVIITGKGDYKKYGKQVIEFNILPVDISNAYAQQKMILNKDKNKKQSFEVYYRGKKLVEKKDYILSKNEDGTYNADGVEGGNYTGTLLISPYYCETSAESKLKNISKAEVALARSKYTYTGNEIKPTIISVTMPGVGELTEEDYIVANYENNLNAGTASVVLVGKGEYTGSLKVKFTIGKSKLKDSEFIVGDTINYVKNTGNQISVLAKYGNTILGRDYSISYKNNKKVGTAQVIITGIGNRSGELVYNYEIIPSYLDYFAAFDLGHGLYKVIDNSGNQLTNRIDYYVEENEDGLKVIKAVEGGNYTSETIALDATYKKGTVNLSSLFVKVDVPEIVDTNGCYLNSNLASDLISLSYKGQPIECYGDYLVICPNETTTSGTVKVYILGINYDYSGIREVKVNLQ